MLNASTGRFAIKGFIQNIEDITIKKKDFNQVHYTARNCHLVVMALKPKKEIGMEVKAIAPQRQRVAAQQQNNGFSNFIPIFPNTPFPATSSGWERCVD